MTAPFANKEWIETKEEITNWFMFNDFEHVLRKYDNKETGWLWWKKRYSDYCVDNNSSEYFKKIEKNVTEYNTLPSWKKPFVSFFSRINTKRKLLYYYYAKELLKKTKSYYYFNKAPDVFIEINNLISKVKNNSFVKNFGERLNKFAFSVFSFINPALNIVNLADAPKNETIDPEPTPNDILSPALQKTLFYKINKVLEKIEFSDLQRWLASLDITKPWIVSDSKFDQMWKLYPLLTSNNNYVKKITLFYLMLHALKPALLNYEEIINQAINQSNFIYLSINLDVLNFRQNNYQKLLFEKLLNNYPVNIDSIMIKIKCGTDILLKASSSDWSTFKIDVIYPKEFTSLDESQSYEFVLSNILKNLPIYITHLDLSEALLANVQDLASLFKNIPSTVQTIDIADEQLLKHDDHYLATAFNALPKHLRSIKILNKAMSEENKIRLDNLSTNLKTAVTQNISLKNIAVDFISKHMKGSYDDENKKLNFRIKNENKSVSVPQDIGDVFIKKHQMGIKY